MYSTKGLDNVGARYAYLDRLYFLILDLPWYMGVLFLTTITVLMHLVVYETKSEFRESHYITHSVRFGVFLSGLLALGAMITRVIFEIDTRIQSIKNYLTLIEHNAAYIENITRIYKRNTKYADICRKIQGLVGDFRTSLDQCLGSNQDYLQQYTDNQTNKQQSVVYINESKVTSSPRKSWKDPRVPKNDNKEIVRMGILLEVSERVCAEITYNADKIPEARDVLGTQIVAWVSNIHAFDAQCFIMTSGVHIILVVLLFHFLMGLGSLFHLAEVIFFDSYGDDFYWKFIPVVAFLSACMNVSIIKSNYCLRHYRRHLLMHTKNRRREG